MVSSMSQLRRTVGNMPDIYYRQRLPAERAENHVHFTASAEGMNKKTMRAPETPANSLSTCRRQLTLLISRVSRNKGRDIAKFAK
jgi:hypothetical protein